MDVIILMAGRGSRFLELDRETPKPLLKLHGHELVHWVVKNLSFATNQRFIFVCLKEHVERFGLNQVFRSWGIDFEIVISDQVTEGAACSALLARPFLRNRELIIANSDQYVHFDHAAFLSEARKHDGFIMSMNASGPKWSYIKTDENNLVTLVKEKDPISSTGTVGIYYFKSSSYFETAALEMIDANDRYNNEFYLAPSYNYLVKKNLRIGHFNVGDIGREMIGLGTASDFTRFRDDPASRVLAQELFS